MTVSPLNHESIAAFQRGSYESVAQLYHLHYSSLYDFAEQLILNKKEAHHIVQETFIKLYMMREQFDTVANIKAFLYITVRNICFAYMKSPQADAAGTEPAPYGDEPKNTFRFNEEAARAEAIQKLHTELGRLPEPCQTIIRLLFCKRMPVTAVAAQLGTNQVAVAKDRIKAIQLLREQLDAIHLFSVPLFVYFLTTACFE